MHKTLLLLSAVCALAMTGCAAPQGQYQPAPRPAIDPLPPHLVLTEQDRQLCRRLLLKFSPTEQTLRESCGSTSASSSVSKRAGQ